MAVPDNNTINNAGEVGVELADQLAEKMVEVIDGYPAIGGPNHTPAEQKAAIARLAADNIYRYAEELER